MALKAKTIADLNAEARRCRRNGHKWPADDEKRGVEFIWTKERGFVIEAEVRKVCENGCGTMVRLVYEVKNGGRFYYVGRRYTYSDVEPYLFEHLEGSRQIEVREELRGEIAKELFPKTKFR